MRRALTVLVVAATLAGCGGSEPDYASLRPRDLAVMPLPPAALGDAARGLVLDVAESGYVNNRKAAEDTADPDDTAEDVVRAGRLSGYNLGYWDEDLSRLVSRRGVVEVTSGVDLFRTARQARAFLDSEIAKYRRLRGTEIERGLELAEVDATRVDELAETAWVVVVRAQVEGLSLRGTFVAFARDRVIGSVMVTRPDAVDERARVLRLAKALDRRVERAARAELDEVPIKLVDTSMQSASGDERLAKLVLTTEDVPDGVRVVREGELPGKVFEREFDASDVPIGRSHIVDLESRAELFASPAAAQARLTQIARDLRNAANAAEAFSGEAGVELRRPRVRSLGAEPDAVAFRVDGTAAGERYAAVIATVRVDRALGTVFAAGLARELRNADVLALVLKLRERMATALGVA
jgi:hypothetical protein